MPAIKTYREAVFSGWFGPMGVGAVFLSMIAKEQMESIYEEEIEKPVIIELISPVVLFIVLASTLVHGTTIPLFQLGKRIRTRTLSITSTGSNNVVRLPKLQFGQPLNFRRSQAENGDLGEGPMSETQRNTLINTIERKKEEESAAYASDTGDHRGYTIDIDDTAEEDFLPGDSDDERMAGDHYGASQSAVPSNTELQGIRFLEPVNPRGAMQPSTNLEKNEASVSSLRSWLRRNKEEAADENNADSTSYSSPLRNMFRRSKSYQSSDQPPNDDDLPVPPHSEKEAEQVADIPGVTKEQADKAEEAYHHSIHPRIEIWEEDSHIVIEDTSATEPPAVLSKNDPEWKEKTREKVKELEKDIAESSVDHSNR